MSHATLNPQRYTIASALFTRFIGFVYILAFASLGLQVDGLLGPHGVAPFVEYFNAVRDAIGTAAYWQLPSIFWFVDSHYAPTAVCIFGVLAGLLALLGRAQAGALSVAFVSYLSLFSIGNVFTAFQWDLLLLESGFLAILATTRLRLTPLLFRLLLFRFMFLSGCVKLLSGDLSWRSLSALQFHFETQPLPSPLAWYAHQLPEQLLEFGVLATLFIELLLPFLIFMNRRARVSAAIGIISLELLIALTGNYNYFNLLTIGLTVFLFDDELLARRGIVSERWLTSATRTRHSVAWPGAGGALALRIVAVWIIIAGALETARPFFKGQPPQTIYALTEIAAPLRIVNTYGLFAVMTTTRPEIIIEGSADGRQWLAYDFHYKPGQVQLRPGWVAPHQPRLDWQMWFAALSSAERNPWFSRFMRRLLENETAVTSLLARNPFENSPPRYVRALLYDYRFASPQERRGEHRWWTRQLSGIYYPASSLSPLSVTTQH